MHSFPNPSFNFIGLKGNLISPEAKLHLFTSMPFLQDLAVSNEVLTIFELYFPSCLFAKLVRADGNFWLRDKDRFFFIFL